MELRGLIWLDEIVDKLAWKHNVTCLEVNEVLSSQPHNRFVEKGHREGERMGRRQHQAGVCGQVEG